MTVPKINTPLEINKICTELATIGTENGKDLLVATKTRPTIARKSGSFFSRFYKPQCKRLNYAFHNTIVFLKAYEKQLANEDFAEKNIRALEHLHAFFSTKRNISELYEIKLLIERIRPKMFAQNRKYEALLLKEQQGVEVCKLQHEKNAKELEKQLAAEKKYALDFPVQLKNYYDVSYRQLDQSFLDKTLSYCIMASRKKYLHVDNCDLTILTKDSKISAQSTFVLRGLSESNKPLQGNTLNIFKDFSAKVVEWFLCKVSGQPTRENLSIDDLKVYIKFLLLPEVNLHGNILNKYMKLLKVRVNQLGTIEELFDFYKEVLETVRPQKETLTWITWKQDFQAIIKEKFAKIISSQPQLLKDENLIGKIAGKIEVSRQKDYDFFLACILQEIFSPELDIDSIIKFKSTLKKYLHSDYLCFRILYAVIILFDKTENDKTTAIGLLEKDTSHRGFSQQFLNKYFLQYGNQDKQKSSLDFFHQMYDSLLDSWKDFCKQELVNYYCSDNAMHSSRSVKFLEEYEKSNTSFALTLSSVRATLAICYREGVGCIRDYPKALRFYRKAYDASRSGSYSIPKLANFLNNWIPVQTLIDKFGDLSTEEEKHRILDGYFRYPYWTLTAEILQLFKDLAEDDSKPEFQQKAIWMLGEEYSRNLHIQNKSKAKTYFDKALRIVTSPDVTKMLKERLDQYKLSGFLNSP